ncbi:hypothetical protein [Limosilactobacillus allomucosae]|uniref:Uncharacterized protein n=1 Tax=Limosilactobacillus allomucosae TaxID=3142938 RepID=A0ABV0I6V5_9LACO
MSLASAGSFGSGVAMAFGGYAECLSAPRSASINQTSAIVKTKGNKKTASVAERRELDIA